MTQAIFFSALALCVVSSLGLLGLLTLSWGEERLQRAMPAMIAVAAGVLIGEAVFHLIPESLSGKASLESTGFAVGLGWIVSFGIELLSNLGSRSTEIKPVARISLISESMHNAVDGAIIAGAFLVSAKMGILATLAIALHEIPHELGNFAILIHAGYDRIRAVRLNLLSAGCAFLGGAVVLATGKAAAAQVPFVLPFAAGCFLYMAIVDLAPALWKSHGAKGWASVGYGVTAGLIFMLLLAGRG